MWTSTIDLAAADSGQPSAGPSALVLIALLGVAVVLLVRSMDRRLRRMPSEFPLSADERSGPEAPPESADALPPTPAIHAGAVPRPADETTDRPRPTGHELAGA